MNESWSLSSPGETRYQYEVCGLRMESDILFSLPQSTRRTIPGPDIRFSLKALGRPTEIIYPNRARLGEIKNGAGYPSITVWQLDQAVLLDCHNTERRVEFVMPRDGRWIDGYASSGTTVEDIELWLFGLVMSFILQSRGIFSLHAAAVNLGGKAVAFLGANGYGKSTLAYFLVRNGHALITDDVLPLVDNLGRLCAAAGCPSMNLWPQTLHQVGTRDSDLPGDGAKHRYSVDRLGINFCKTVVPLERIYFLQPVNDQTRVEVTKPSKSRALMDLFAFTRSNSTIEVGQQEVLLKTYAHLLSQVPVRKLACPRGFEHLPEIHQAVLRDLSYEGDELGDRRI